MDRGVIRFDRIYSYLIGCKPQPDLLFRLAAQHNRALDLHADEQDDPTIRTVDYIARKTIQQGWQGRVTVGHLCTLMFILKASSANYYLGLAERVTFYGDTRKRAVSLDNSQML